MPNQLSQSNEKQKYSIRTFRTDAMLLFCILNDKTFISKIHFFKVYITERNLDCILNDVDVAPTPDFRTTLIFILLAIWNSMNLGL